MTDRERYRAAFAVRAPEGAVRRAVEQAGRSARPRRRISPKILLAAALVGALLVTSVGAEINSGAVTNLLAPWFGSARTELLEEVGRPVGASVSAGGYTLTADAIIGDRCNMQIIYTFTRDDGKPIPENARFWDLSDASGAGSGASCSTVFLLKPPPATNKMQFYQKYSTDTSFSSRIHVSFGRFAVCEGTEEVELLAEGPWELSFTRSYPDTTRQVPVQDLTVTGLPGHSCQIKTLSYSCMGVTVTGFTPFFGSGMTFDQLFSVSVTLKDGSVLPLTIGYSADSSSPVSGWEFTAEARSMDQNGFGLLDPDEIAAITLCDTTIPVP